MESWKYLPSTRGESTVNESNREQSTEFFWEFSASVDNWCETKVTKSMQAFSSNTCIDLTICLGTGDW